MKPDRDAPTKEWILFYLKTRGPQTAATLARRLKVTPMAVRQHLQALEAEGAAGFDAPARGVGRPRKLWHITDAGASGFPEGYADLAVDLLGSMREAFGADGLDRLIRQRTKHQIRQYRDRLPDNSSPLSKRIAALARIRSEEGYMAEWKKHSDGTFSLIENHCPICAAAEICQGLCAGELDLFQSCFGKQAKVEREEHILDGARRCLYRITPG